MNRAQRRANRNLGCVLCGKLIPTAELVEHEQDGHKLPAHASCSRQRRKWEAAIGPMALRPKDNPPIVTAEHREYAWMHAEVFNALTSLAAFGKEGVTR